MDGDDLGTALRAARGRANAGVHRCHDHRRQWREADCKRHRLDRRSRDQGRGRRRLDLDSEGRRAHRRVRQVYRARIDGRERTSRALAELDLYRIPGALRKQLSGHRRRGRANSTQTWLYQRVRFDGPGDPGNGRAGSYQPRRARGGAHLRRRRHRGLSRGVHHARGARLGEQGLPGPHQRAIRAQWGPGSRLDDARPGARRNGQIRREGRRFREIWRNRR